MPQLYTFPYKMTKLTRFSNAKIPKSEKGAYFDQIFIKLQQNLLESSTQWFQTACKIS